VAGHEYLLGFRDDIATYTERKYLHDVLKRFLGALATLL
jgi:hypothetical protein